MEEYINIPLFTTINDISNNDFSLSATQYKQFLIKNKNTVTVRSFLYRDLLRTDLGNEVGSDAYVEDSNFKFIKTKALQKEFYLLDINSESVFDIVPKAFLNSNLKKGDLIISKDSNVGEIVILDKDYPNSMLCGALYKLPVEKNKYYFLAFLKSNVFRQQIDFIVPKGSTIRHGKTKFLNCLIPMPNKNHDQTVLYVEALTKAIINKEIEIRNKYKEIIESIQKELEKNQNSEKFNYSLPNINDILKLERLDSSLYSYEFKKNEFLITNYKFGFFSIKQLGYEVYRGQNLQISNIGHSIYTDIPHNNYYKLAKPTNITRYGTICKFEYLGNQRNLLCLNYGDVIFGAEGTFRSFVNLSSDDKVITNIHGIILSQTNKNMNKSIFIKLMLDFYREKNMLSAYAVGGNGGSLAIEYLDYLKFPNFPIQTEKSIVKLYNNSDSVYETEKLTIDEFIDYDNKFNQDAGIYELDKSMNYLKQKLNVAINNIVDDIEVDIRF